MPSKKLEEVAIQVQSNQISDGNTSEENYPSSGFGARKIFLVGLGVILILGLLFGTYFHLINQQKQDLSQFTQSKYEECLRLKSEYELVFGISELSCAKLQPSLNLPNNWLQLNDLVNQVETSFDEYTTPTRQKLSKVKDEYALLKATQAELSKKILKLGYEGGSEISLDQHLPPKPSDLLIAMEQIKKDNQKLSARLQFYHELQNYKLTKFWNRLTLAKNLGLAMSTQAQQLISEYRLEENRPWVETELYKSADYSKIKDFSSALTQATFSLMRETYPKLSGSKNFLAEIDSVNLQVEQTVQLPILMYHRIEEFEALPETQRTPGRQAVSISPDRFRWELDQIKGAGYQTVDLNELELAYINKDQSFFDGKKIILTFDDGHIEHYKLAFPELQKRGMKGVFGIVTNTVKDDLESRNESILTWAKLQEMQDGGMQIVSHTHSHCSLGSFRFLDGRVNPDKGDYRACDFSNVKEINYGKGDFELMPAEQLRFELLESRKKLAARLGKNQPYLILPYGAYNDLVLDLAWESGYNLTLGVGGGPELDLAKPFMINRVTVLGGTKPGEKTGWFARL